MFKPNIFPAFWSVGELVSHGDDVIYELACKTTGTITSCKVLVGRCLLAMEETKLYEKFSMSGVIHFAIGALGLSKKEAYTFRRVARELLNLPLMSQAAEKGSVAWSKLREVVSVAVPETEELWLKLCEEFNCRQVRTLVTLTPKGGVPGDLPQDDESHGSEYRCRFSPQLVIIIERVLRQRSQKEGRAITFAEAVEQLFTEALMGKPYDEVEEKMRLEAHREHLAEQMAKVPLVKRAKAVAEELDLHEEAGRWSHGGTSVAPCGSDCCASEFNLAEKEKHRSPRGTSVAPCSSDGCSSEFNLAEEEKHWSPRGTSVPPCSSDGCASEFNLAEEEKHWSPRGMYVPPCSSDCYSSEFDLAEDEKHWSPKRPSAPFGHSECCAPQGEDPHQALLALATGHLRFNPDSRLATPAQRLALLRRDRYRCQVPGCPNTRFLDLHHVRWYSQKGETQPGNLTTICRSCHTKVHEKKLHITGSPDQGYTFTDTEGRSLGQLHRLEKAAWLDFWIGWTGEEHESYASRVGAMS